MDFPGNLLIMIDDEEEKKLIETIASFLGIEWQSGGEDDCLALLDSGETDAAVITRGSGKNSIPALLVRYPDVPFIGIDLEVEYSNANMVGSVSTPFTLEDFSQKIRYCSSFMTLHKGMASKKQDNREETLARLLVGQGDAIQEIRHLIEQVAGTDANVLILGESGTGKEVVARAVHELSKRSKGAFVPINCGAIPPDLLESELFGHEKGSFTGAISSRKGRFELAEGGTVFLDEIGDMPLPMQVKLLRVLQERIFERVGGSKPIKADVRVIAATHRHLEDMIAEGKFREDLFYRLNVFPIDTPPLRDRADDIPLLLQELVRRHSENHHVSVKLTQRAMASLMKHPWPGNVRELSNLVERLMILHPNCIVDAVDLPAKYRYDLGDGVENVPTQIETQPGPHDERDALLSIFSASDDDSGTAGKNVSVTAEEENEAAAMDPLAAEAFAVMDPMPVSSTSAGTVEDFGEAAAFAQVLPESGINLKDTIADMEINLIKQALDRVGGITARAAELLGMRRTTLVEKMKKYGIVAKDF